MFERLKKNMQSKSTQGRAALEDLKTGLGRLAAVSQERAPEDVQLTQEREGIETVPDQSISDDINATGALQRSIERDEAVVRDALSIFGIDYDALIQMDGKSVYSRAVTANPAVLDIVALSKKPVLAALKIATQFKPYAEFLDKYGDEPEVIRKAIKEELMADVKSSAAKKERKSVQNEQGHVETPIFAQVSGRYGTPKKSTAQDVLEDIFGKKNNANKRRK